MTHSPAVSDEAGDTPVALAVDGETVRGSRTDGAAVHLPAAALETLCAAPAE
ncbi:hypothetical protein OH738_29075 [Streptomyces hirsutus]|uniref:hypothetical protein n=1 Tax=Streptomyces hirsutus TaxID=35620 RepID=UPI00386D5D3A|nr:hypothetical protein OH738_29075 [Streptomyces hirsutus]